MKSKFLTQKNAQEVTLGRFSFHQIDLSYHEFPCFACKGNEIHALRQIGHINLLGFGGEAASLEGLTHEVGDAVGFRW